MRGTRNFGMDRWRVHAPTRSLHWAQWAIQKPIGLAGRSITSRGVHSADGVLATAYAGAPGLAGSSAIVIHSHRRGPVR